MNNSKYILKSEYEITSADADMFGRLRPGALLNMLIQAAGKSADSLAFGYNNLTDNGLFWVLSRMSIEISKTAKWHDSIIIETWPKDVNGLLYLRDFLIKNQDEDIIAKASSAWLAINLESRRPKIIPDLEAPFTELKNYHALEQVPEKLESVQGEIVSERLVDFTDIDLNNHLTSVRYIDWMIDSFDIDFHRNNYLNKLSINYIKETAPEESLEIRRDNIDNIFVFEGKNLQSSKISFRGKLGFSIKD